MKQGRGNALPPKAGGGCRGGVESTFRDVVETLVFLKDVTRRLTCAEELGWPEWRQWF